MNYAYDVLFLHCSEYGTWNHVEVDFICHSHDRYW